MGAKTPASLPHGSPFCLPVPLALELLAETIGKPEERIQARFQRSPQVLVWLGVLAIMRICRIETEKALARRKKNRHTEKGLVRPGSDQLLF